MQEKVIDIEELAQDQHNFNKGTEQGQELMERSFKEMGAGRSILIDIRAPFTQGGGLRRGSSTSEAAKPSGGIAA